MCITVSPHVLLTGVGSGIQNVVQHGTVIQVEPVCNFPQPIRSTEEVKGAQRTHAEYNAMHTKLVVINWNSME